MEKSNLSYREVILDLAYEEKWNEIIINTGGSQSTLQDIKVIEKAGGYSYKAASQINNRNRFIYWRTYHDVLELSEISLDLNLYENNIRYKFTDSPILSVTIMEQGTFVTVLVTTVSSLHRINFPHPDTMAKVDSKEIKVFSIFRDINAVVARDSSSYYEIGHSTLSNNTIPHTASSYLSSNGEEAYFALAYANHLVLFTMNCHTGQTECNNLKEQYIIPRIFSNIREVLSGKSNTPDCEYITCLIFNTVGGQNFLVALYRDNILRMWSTSTLQCINTFNCAQQNLELQSQGPQASLLRKIDEANLCVFLNSSMGSEFVNIKISCCSGNIYTMTRTRVLSTPQSDLVDFVVSASKIWALWCNAQGDFSISNFSLMPGTGINWISAAMEPPPDRYSVSVEQGMDAKQAYCSYIFHPGKFDKSVIAKALMMFRRSNVVFDANLPFLVLKDQVCQAVENEIQNELKDFDFIDDEYVDISARFWERFFSCCEQYHIKLCQPMGLVLLDVIDAVCIVKKSTFSLLRPCEILEHVMLTGENVNIENILSAHFHKNERIGRDLVNLITLLTQLDQWISDDIKLDFDKKLYQLEMPDIIISKFISEVFSDQNKEVLTHNLMVSVCQSLQSICDLRAAIATLLDILRLDNGSSEALQIHEKASKFNTSFGHLFESNIGLSLLSESVRQTALIRYSLCRDLLFLQQILIDIILLPCDVLETIRSQFMPETVVFVQSYYVMVWICETPIYCNQISASEKSIYRLNLFQLCDSRPISINQYQYSTLLRIFLNSKGLDTTLALFCESHVKDVKNVKWHYTLIPFLIIINQLIWPISGKFIFGEWLFASCQPIIIQEYVRLLNNWCEWNNCSRQFILAVSFLQSGEAHKAYDLFLQSAKGISTEQFLYEKVLKTQDRLISCRAIAQYYLQVIQLFEHHNELDHIISLAQTAIGILDKNDHQLAMFQSIIFNKHLLLEHYKEAYHSLIYNADPGRRKDCLRQLVVCLFNKRRLDILMHFPYAGLQDEFENIIESRARSMNIEDNEHYNFLYAFYVTKGNMRKASIVMYEQAMRFHLESDSFEGLQRRYDCLLACINCLQLVDENYQWIAKPVIGDDITSSPDTNLQIDFIKEKVIVLEIKDIKKELLQTEAFICLENHNRNVELLLNVELRELIVILSSCGLYTAAVKIAEGHNINVTPILDSLAGTCVRIVDESPNEPWSWLQENDLTDLPHKNNAVDMAWLLLQKLVQIHEEKGSTAIRKSIVNKLLSLNAFLPQWLYTSYKADNISELLRLFVKYNRFLEANDLAKEYIWAMLGVGGGYFNLNHPITAATTHMCFPITGIDSLLYGLELNSSEFEYKKAFIELQELVGSYINTVFRTSKDRINYYCQIEADRK